MADQDFNIRVVTTADTSGIRETTRSLQELERIRASGGKVPAAEFFGAGGTLGGDVKEAADAAEKTAEAAGHLGTNLTRARTEAVVLVRELATGVPTMRTLSSLLGSLGLQYGAAALAGLGLNKAIQAYGEYQVKINSQMDEHLTKLTGLALKWGEAAKSVTSFEELGKLASSFVPQIEAAADKARQFQNQGQSTFQSYLNILAHLPGITGTVFTQIAALNQQFHDQRQQQLNAESDSIRQQAVDAMRTAEFYRQGFNAEKVKPFSEAVSDLTEKIRHQMELAEGFARGGDPMSYGKAIAQAENYKNQLKEITQLQAQQRAAAEASVSKLGLLTPTGQFIEGQRREVEQHLAERAGLVQKREEAIATGDTARARAIEDELKDDKFLRDKRRDQLQRYVANQESISGGETASQADRLKYLGKEGLRKFEAAQAELGKIYGQEAREPGRDNSGDILGTLKLILQQFQ